ncbi:ABC transporter permease [Actinospica durhamensis]|uniref:ABC transporter permease n=1 Tax=Actinospica durhamensis TaxID=1508375 RepID=A0A941IUV0_9ACTN|nr:ABC transporter permease [Actinospica durhamensis]MBR7836066.1 ABC transporter permease [Actinospica durhamensis]
MNAALSAEWTKLRTLPSVAWLLGGIVALTAGSSAGIGAATHVTSRAGQGGPDPVKLALTGVDLGQAIVAVLAVLVISEEYDTGMIRTSLTAVPRRHLVLAAKATTVGLLTLVAAVPAVAASVLAGRLLLPGAGLGPADGYSLISIADGPTLRAAAGAVLYLVLIAVLGLGIATAIRDTAVSIGAVLALLYLPTLLVQALGDPLRRHLEQIAPGIAGLAVENTTDLASQPLTPWAGLGVLAAWATGSLLLAGLLLHHRDA